jgi:hypothetical protein
LKLYLAVVTEQQRPLRVLALDGGGVRGLYTGVLLRDLSGLLGREAGKDGTDIGRNFELISGTSTGGILACALAAGVPPDRIVDLYEQKGPLIFADPMPASRPRKFGWGLRNARKAANSSAPLKQALTEIFGDCTLSGLFRDRGIALAIPATRILNHETKVFKTPHFDRYGVDGDHTIVDVCLATSAAPVFLPLHEMESGNEAGRGTRYADGGLWANNPTLVALLEALEMCEKAESDGGAKRSIEILSIGTCSVPVGDMPTGNLDCGLADWQIGVKTTALSMNAQSAGVECVSRLLAQRLCRLGREVSIVRIADPPISQAQAAHLQLDLATPEAIQLLKQLGSSRAQAVLSCTSNPQHQDGQFIKRMFTE